MNLWKRQSLKSKLILLILFMVIILSIVVMNSISNLRSVRESTGLITTYSIPNLTNFSRMDLSFRSLRIELRTLGLPGLTEEQKKKALEGVNQYINEFEEAEKKYLSIDFLPGEEELYNPLKNEWTAFKALGGKILAYNASTNPADKEKMLTIFRVDCPEAAAKVDILLKAINNFHQQKAAEFVQKSDTEADRGNLFNILLGTMGVISSLLIGYLVSNAIAKSLSRVADLLKVNALHVSKAATQIAGSSQELSQATTEQAASLEETAASLEEISSMISKAAHSAEDTSSSSTQSHKKADQGRVAVEQMVHSMQEISQSNDSIMQQINISNQQLNEIVKVIQEIGNKTKVINEIVFQTKLLSFNASVEAARAGEHGKGFAVVAEEVGNLAQMSGNAAKEISDMLDGSIHKVEKIVSDTKTKVESLIQEGKQKVESGSSVANQCATILSEIVENVSKVSGLAKEISQASQEQAQGVGEINKAMAQLDSVTQQNSATSQETATAASSLSGQAEQLKDIISDLMQTIYGQDNEVKTIPHQTITQTRSVASNVHLLKTPSKIAPDQAMPSFNDDRFKDV